MYMYMCTYTHTHIYHAHSVSNQEESFKLQSRVQRATDPWCVGWHYLSSATCLIRPRLLYVCFVVARSTIMCYIPRHVGRHMR